MHYYYMYSLVMNSFSHDLMKMQVDLLRYLQCLINLLTCIQYLHSAWFLDGKTSKLVDLKVALP